MTEKNNLATIKNESTRTERIEKNDDVVEVGQWFWVQDDSYSDQQRGIPLLACVMSLGTNHVKLNGPKGKHDHGHRWRIHFNDVHKFMKRELEPESYIQNKISHYKAKINHQVEKVKLLTSNLGVGANIRIPGTETEEASKALTVLSGTNNVGNYEKALIKAKEEDLPALFEEIKESNCSLFKWMGAESLPLEALADSVNGSIGEVEDRIFKVSLYAGLTENITHCAKGEPATINDKLHIMQRRLYMDEECLLDYRHGGMEFKDIRAFDRFLIKRKNRNRILPFPRCMVAMRVRRQKKDRYNDGSLQTSYINMNLEKADETTFLYIRNGGNVYRMNCDLDFSEMTFPNKDTFDPNKQMMFKMSCSSVDRMITRNEYDQMVKENEENEIKSAKWQKENPDKHHFHDPYRGHHGSLGRYEPLDPTSLYYDDAMKHIANQINQYNRIVLIIQGLFDRSEVLHPHPPVRTWESDDFGQNIKLVYDGSGVIEYGEAPDFEKYWIERNESMDSDSILIGQEKLWMIKEAHIENERNKRRYRRGQRDFHHEEYSPWGDPGPGYIQRADKWHPRSKKFTFRWERARRSTGYYCDNGSKVKCSITVEAKELFNVSAYALGDFKQFFEDPRTRGKYLQWAPMLIAAEEYHAGRLKLDSEENYQAC